MIYGYINSLDHLSNKEQKFTLTQRGNCEKIFSDQRSKEEKSPKLGELLKEIRQGDQLVVCSIYVFAMSFTDFFKLVNELHEKGIGFMSFREKINDGELLSELGKFAKFTRKQRSMIGLRSRTREKTGGRKKGLTKEAEEQAKAAAALWQNNMNIKSIMTSLGIKSTATIYKYLRHEGIEVGKEKRKRSK